MHVEWCMSSGACQVLLNTFSRSISKHICFLALDLNCIQAYSQLQPGVWKLIRQCLRGASSHRQTPQVNSQILKDAVGKQ